MSTQDPSAVAAETPADTNSIEVTVPEGYTWFFVQNASTVVDKLLKDELAWRDPNAQYTDRYKRGSWDGFHRIYNTEHSGAPIGLLGRAVELLEAEGYSVSTTIEGDRSGASITTEWNFPHSLRNYQEEAVEASLEEKMGVISIPTGGGKTVVALNLINKVEQQAVVLVHTKNLLYQWADQIESVLGVEPGIIGDGEWSEGPVTVATVQSLLSKDLSDLDGQYGIAIFDECHTTSGAKKMQQVGLDFDTEYRIGLSATPWRATPGEELEIEAAVGGCISVIDAEQLIDEGHLAKPEFRFVDADGQRTAKPNEDYHDVVRRCRELAPVRNNAVAETAAGLVDEGYTVHVSVDRINQGKLLEYALDGATTASDVRDDIIGDGDDTQARAEKDAAIDNLTEFGDYNAVFLHGSDVNEVRQEAFEQFQAGDIDILISTLLKEGVDIPEISAIVHAEGGKSEIERIQRAGRALRPSNGDHAVIADIRDQGKYLADHFEERVDILDQYYGAYGPTGGIDDRVEKVEAYLEAEGVFTDPCSFSVRDDGSVTIELDGYMPGNEFSKFRNAIQNATGIRYNGDANVCSPGWVEQLSTPQLG